MPNCATTGQGAAQSSFSRDLDWGKCWPTRGSLSRFSPELTLSSQLQHASYTFPFERTPQSFSLSSKPWIMPRMVAPSKMTGTAEMR